MMTSNNIGVRILEDRLPGIDDPAVLAEIARKSLWDSHVLAPAVGRALLIAIAGGILCFALELFFTRDRLFLACVLSITSGLGVFVGTRHWRRGAESRLNDVLRSMGRCTCCGYLRPEGGNRQCPECGGAP